MARRRLLNDVQWAALLSPPADEREIVRHYTLSAEDLAAVSTKRGNHNRIGFALTLCYLRFPGRALAIGETPPLPLIRFVARQLKIPPEAFAAYARRDQTRREHLAELSRSLGCKAFERSHLKALIGWLAPMAHKSRSPEQLVAMVIDEMRRRPLRR
jgi:TnpA family transposase